MCRFAAFLGEPIRLEDIVDRPSHSLIAQSMSCQKSKLAMNGDGFGIAWYSDREEPGTFRDTAPAWSDSNLRSICRHVRSPLFLAHVRAATHGSNSRENCHPFVSGNWSFMHNGQLGQFTAIKRHLENALCDEHYAQRAGVTDSELLFLTMLDEGLKSDPLGAVRRTISRTERTYHEAGLVPHIRLTAAFSDGETLFAVRYATDNLAPTLFSTAWGERGHCIASEPLDGEIGRWREVPRESFVTVSTSGVVLTPLCDQAAVLENRLQGNAAEARYQ